ncbi:MAG TPA: ROK family protein, partial [Candidatus Methanoperedens sp.]|nr:ROK family protein [Candidatus Methanoperedens sp.]
MAERMGREFAIGMDLGGTNLRVAAIGREGGVAALHREETGAREGPEPVIERIVAAVRGVAARLETEGGSVRGVMLGAPGIISSAAGTVVSSPNLPGWRDVPLRDRVAAALGLPVRLENDANAAAYGEYWRGAGQGCASMVLLTLGTGVGGGLVLGGALWRGADGMAGEIGHLTVDPAGRTCRCGNVGCLETYASATGIVDRYRELAGIEEAVSAEVVHVRALEGDANARQAYREAGRALGLAFATLVNLLNPERIVIGGGVLPAWDLFMPHAEQELRRRAFAAPVARVRFARAALGDLAGVTGAG